MRRKPSGETYSGKSWATRRRDIELVVGHDVSLSGAQPYENSREPFSSGTSSGTFKQLKSAAGT